MTMKVLTGVIIILIVLSFGRLCAHCNENPTSFVLQRANQSGLAFHKIRAQDRRRHAQLLQIVNLPLQGLDDLADTDGLYPSLYTVRMKIGTPPREYNMQIDTGSDISWIQCHPCRGCPSSSQLGLKLSNYNPASSSTANPISCDDIFCTSSDNTRCENSQCTYYVKYRDGSTTRGYCVSDKFHFNTIVNNSVAANFSTSLYFGCSNYQTGILSKPDIAVDGLLGLGHKEDSIISQLASRCVTPYAFSHCLTGGHHGGTLAFGEVVAPGMQYTPFVSGMGHYNLNLQMISVGGNILDIDQKVFANSHHRQTFIDSGSTFSYIADEAYDIFIKSIKAAVPADVQFYTENEWECFTISSSVSELPIVTLHFEGGASLSLKPKDYLIPQTVGFDWCIGILKGEGITILGDSVLRDKLFFYDLAKRRLGFADYNCSSAINVSSAYGRCINTNASWRRSTRDTVNWISVLLFTYWLA